MGGPGGVGTGGSFGENPYAGANTGTMMALGTLANPQPNMLAMGSNTLMPYHKRATANYPSQSATLLRSSNHSYNGAFQVSTSLSVWYDSSFHVSSYFLVIELVLEGDSSKNLL